MTIIIGADPAGSKLKDVIKDYLLEKSYDFKDVSDGSDFVDTTLAVVAEVNQEEGNLGIVIDAYGVGPFMTATKVKGMIARSFRRTFCLYDKRTQQFAYYYNR